MSQDQNSHFLGEHTTPRASIETPPRPTDCGPSIPAECVLWILTADEAQEFCTDHKLPPLTDTELEDLSIILSEDLDGLGMMADAIDRLRQSSVPAPAYMRQSSQ